MAATEEAGREEVDRRMDNMWERSHLYVYRIKGREGSTLDKRKQTVDAYNAYNAKADNGLRDSVRRREDGWRLEGYPHANLPSRS